jgi:hypothetical protein
MGHAIEPRAARRHLLAAGLALAGLVAVGAAHADERHRREAHERYRSPHWVYDNRYHHGRYYPSTGYSVAVLPGGYLSLSFGGGRLFYQGGVWFRAQRGGYVVVRAPLGIVVPALPPYYDTVWVGPTPYYYANETYYVQAPGGYAVVAPPANVQLAPPQPAPPPAPAAAPAPSAAPQQAAGNWYYCESAKAYYPYVSECKEGWRTVPATPPGVTR